MYGGLHEAVETKEHLTIKESSRMVAKITIQNYFKMYENLSGMTGTAWSSKKEFKKIYNMDVKKVPTNKKIKRIDRNDYILKNKNEKNRTIIDEIKKSQGKGQPVLIGTTSIHKSEELSELLKNQNIKHNVLNAKNNSEEAEIIKQAGRLNKITIATNMAGRGTHIELGRDNDEKEKIMKAGGLKVIGTEKHETVRIDDQLRGRSGRKGQVGETIFILSIEDDLIRIYEDERKVEKFKHKRKINQKKARKNVRKAQKKAENRNYTARKRMICFDEVLNLHREIIYKERREFLNSDVEKILKKFITYFCDTIIQENTEKSIKIIDEIEKNENIKINKKNLCQIKKVIYNRYVYKKEKIGNKKIKEILKNKMLNIIDENWIKHLEEMEELKDNIELQAYAKRNPLFEYCKEGKILFDNMIKKIKMDCVTQLLFGVSYY